MQTVKRFIGWSLIWSLVFVLPSVTVHASAKARRLSVTQKEMKWLHHRYPEYRHNRNFHIVLDHKMKHWGESFYVYHIFMWIPGDAQFAGHTDTYAWLVMNEKGNNYNYLTNQYVGTN